MSIFVSLGGSGSSYVWGKFSNKEGKNGMRPDVCFLPDFWFKRPGSKRLDKRGYLHKPNATCVKWFKERSGGFVLNTSKTIEWNMIRFLEGRGDRDLLLTWSAHWGFFSRRGIRDTIFLLRHPLHNYCSWFKMKRHGSMLKPYGGIHAEFCIKTFARVWNSTAKEALRMQDLNLNSTLLRFEFASRDGKNLPARLAPIISGWKSGKRNSGVLTFSEEALLRKLTSQQFDRIYDRWDL